MESLAPREVRWGDRIDGWRVGGVGGWDRCRVLFVVMVEDDLGLEMEQPAIASHYGVGQRGVMWINGVGGGGALALGAWCGTLVPGDWDRRLTYASAAVINSFAAILLKRESVTPRAPRDITIGAL